jgi:hypothetical protein
MSLTKIQNELHAPKNQRNNFGKYNYRSCEDILEAVKPLLLKYDAILTITDEVKELSNDWAYIDATCKLEALDGDEMMAYKTSAQAGIEKAGGMALPQAFGSASSYARKYALNAMFLIDDTKDADATNTHDKTPQKASKSAPNHVELLKVKCTDNNLKFLDVAKWALSEKNKDINVTVNAKALVANWDKVFPEINEWLIKEGK